MGNQDADGLSRCQYERVKDSDDVEREKMENNIVKVICNIIVTPQMEILPVYMNLLEVTDDQGHPLAQKELKEIRRAQREDSQIEKVAY
ncbi:hypothetical protein DPMN_088433 [Dreissena polymorpha]|uniref:Uncharacterized protein n=1 Tax=Dreissena polymorpha TaxID=45954 RepID=A0A9D4QXA4_DREPO|nr:hypothetical protein DPMN_088433 [Dreissena polymorpha]